MKKWVVNIVAFIFVFCGAFLLLASQWIKDNFETNDFGIILFHLRLPMLGNGVPMIYQFMLKVVVVSLIIAFCVAFYGIVIKMIASLYARLSAIKPLYKSISLVTFAIVLFVLCANIVVNRFHIRDYLQNQKEYSQLYENHYTSYNLANIKHIKQTTQPKQNLILIIAESLESNFSNYIGGGGKPLNIIPNLSKLAIDNIHFSHKDSFGGIYQLYATGGTIAGNVSYMCGIPLNLPLDWNRFDKNTQFLNNATCIGDVLNAMGYKQAYFSSSDLKFAGTEHFLHSHNIEVLDIKYFQSNGILPSKIPHKMNGAWGPKDAVIFDLAKDYLKTIDAPFALYISTLDTHGPRGFVDKDYCQDLEISYENAYKCTDKVISDFISFIEKSPLKDNTTIIILGDHLGMAHFVKQYINDGRKVYNAFINAKFSKKPTKELTQNRLLSHFDITPLILDAIGIKTEFFGLGRNPLYHTTFIENTYLNSLDRDYFQNTFESTLESIKQEARGNINEHIDNLNKEIKKRNKIYDNLWY